MISPKALADSRFMPLARYPLIVIRKEKVQENVSQLRRTVELLAVIFGQILGGLWGFDDGP
jgi:hypothetical protein